MVRVFKAKQPKVFIAENVKGMMTLHQGTIFQRIISAFEQAGYKIFYSLLNAKDYGVPQKRERVIIIGIRGDICAEGGRFLFFLKKANQNHWAPLSVAVPRLAIEDKKCYFSEKAV